MQLVQQKTWILQFFIRVLELKVLTQLILDTCAGENAVKQHLFYNFSLKEVADPKEA